MSYTSRLPLLLALAALLLLPVRSEAQASTRLNALGYGSLGGLAGALATSGADCDGPGFLCIPDEMVVGTIVGLVAGVVVGSSTAHSANEKLAAGGSVSGGHRAAVTFGTALGGAVTGALVSALFINGEGSGTFLGSDEQTVAILSATGAILALVHQHRSWNRAVEGRLAVQPVITLDGRAGVRATLRF